ncbi:formin-binding protein 4-like isoform X2 [Amphiura filiformis]|uniref:formin-binding protein 4-like isoform X2 n=1 Tax=Amphiura filiformis TaxID=82378 RepID=UPI003B212AD5
MGRKRDKGFDSGPKRRTILQINKSTVNNSAHTDSPSHVGAGNAPKAHNPLGLLAHYGDSDDDDVDGDSPIQPRQTTKGGFIGVDGTKPKNEMDEKVADFLAEIDALDPEPDEEHPSELPASSGGGDTNNTTQEAEAPAPVDNGWQELLDENTNCIYYWNTITNEVTWDMPADFQAPAPTEPVASEPSAETTPPQANEPAKVEPVEEKPKPVREEPKVTVEPKKVVKEESVVKEETVKKVPAIVPAVVSAVVPVVVPAAKVAPKAPVVDMFADEVEEKNEDVAKMASKKMPVYGTLKVEYDIDSQEEEESEDEEPVIEPPKPQKPGAYSMFVKGDVLPASMDKEPDSDAKDLAHYDLTLDDDTQESQLSHTNGDAGEEEEDDDVVEMDAGDDIDIDQQLELALERKKAELAQLEEIEKGSSSPRQKRKISSPLNIYDEKGEVNLLSFKKKRLENLKGQKQVQTSDQGTQCDKELDKVAAEDEKYQTVKKLKEEANLKKELSELGSTLTSKLEFLGQTRKGLSKLQILLIEIETRILDWREGALDGKHLLRKLQVADWELQVKESEAVPLGWTCTWNRTHKQYYYTNSTTGESQWDYPADAATATTAQQERLEGNTDGKDSQVMFNRASSQDDSEARARGSTAMLHGNVTSKQLTALSIAEPHVSIIATPPPPPPSAPSPEPPGPPPLPDDAPPLPSDPPPPGTGPDLPPLPPSPPPMPPSPPTPEDSEDGDESEGPSSRPLTPPPLPPFTTAATFGAPPAPPDMDGAVIGKPQVLYTNAPTASGVTIGKPPEIVGGIDGMPVGDFGGAPIAYGAPPAPPSEPSGGGPPASQPVKKKSKKIKKSSAVKKKMPLSLVEKWKQIQEAQAREEEEKRRREEEEDMVIDPSVIAQKRIAEWKKQQLQAGKAAHNPNFETIRGDWRERLKRK